mgnify:CR=1 FL=1
MLTKVMRLRERGLVLGSLLIGLIIGASLGYAGGWLLASEKIAPQVSGKITIRVGLLPLLGYEAYLIEALGLTRMLPPNVDVVYKVFPHGSAEMEAFMAGELDICYVGTVPALVAWDKGAKLKMVAGIYIGGTVLLVRNDTGWAHTVADLSLIHI